jgi:hypothetical protein
MHYNDWKETFSKKHISEETHKLLDEMHALAAHPLAELLYHVRLKELREFAEDVEEMLKAEWRHFLDHKEGHGHDYC